MPVHVPSQEVHLQMIRGIKFVFFVETNHVASYDCARIKTSSIGLPGDDSWIMTGMLIRSFNSGATCIANLIQINCSTLNLTIFSMNTGILLVTWTKAPVEINHPISSIIY